MSFNHDAISVIGKINIHGEAFEKTLS